MQTELWSKRRYRRYEHYIPCSCFRGFIPPHVVAGTRVGRFLRDNLCSYARGLGGTQLNHAAYFCQSPALGGVRWVYNLTVCFGASYKKYATRYWSPL